MSSKEAVNIVFEAFLTWLDKGIELSSTDCESNVLTTASSRRFGLDDYKIILLFQTFLLFWVQQVEIQYLQLSILFLQQCLQYYNLLYRTMILNHNKLTGLTSYSTYTFSIS